MNTAIEKEKEYAKLREEWHIEEDSAEDQHTRETFDRGWDRALMLVDVSESLLEKAYNLIPDGTEHPNLVELKKYLFSNVR